MPAAHGLKSRNILRYGGAGRRSVDAFLNVVPKNAAHPFSQ
jgi:hypothetical protein